MQALVNIGVKYSSIEHYISMGWINPCDFNSFKEGFIRIHSSCGTSKDDWHFDYYAGCGSMVGSPTSSKCITVYQSEILKDNSRRYPIIKKFKWNDVVPIIFKKYREMYLNKTQQLSLFE